MTEYRIIEDVMNKQTQVVKFVDGVRTTWLLGRWYWRCDGRQGAYQKAQLQLQKKTRQRNVG